MTIRKVAAVAAPPVKGRFVSRPTIFEVQRFLDHLKLTGQPDTWPLLELSTPPKNGDFEELVTFSVPDEFRKSVGMAPCPICSPNSPQYFIGVLAWFWEEGVLRAIGHDCAKRHFGVEKANRARHDRIQRQKREATEDFLLDFLPKVGNFRDEVQRLGAVARDIDKVRDTFWRRVLKKNCLKLEKLGQSGVLTIEREVRSEGLDRFGNTTTEWVAEKVSEYPVKGLSFLRQTFQVEAKVVSTFQAMSVLQTGSEGEILNLVADMNGNMGFLQEAERLARNAKSSYEELRELVDDAMDFFDPGNLSNLMEWSRDRRSRAPVGFVYDRYAPYQVKVWSAERPIVAIPIPLSLRRQV